MNPEWIIGFMRRTAASASMPWCRTGAQCESVNQIRVVLGQMPQLLSEIIIEALEERADIAVVGQADNDVGLCLAVEQFRADVVISGLPAERNRALCRLLLVRRPHMSIIGIPNDRSGASQWQLRLYESPLGDVSPEELADAIRLAHATRLKEAP